MSRHRQARCSGCDQGHHVVVQATAEAQAAAYAARQQRRDEAAAAAALRLRNAQAFSRVAAAIPWPREVPVPASAPVP